MDELLLGNREHYNYVALVRLIHNVPSPLRVQQRGRKRPSNERYTPARKLAQLHEQDYCCPDCGEEFSPDHTGNYSSATTEHVIPYMYGGTWSPHNAILLCGDCNVAREQLTTAEKLAIIEAHYGAIDYSLIPVAYINGDKQ